MGTSGVILGAGMTGLAAAIASEAEAFEAVEVPGGICSSYYVRPGERQTLPERPADGNAYRFEIGGGHWIFGGDPIVLRYIRELTLLKAYVRRSSVYFPKERLFVPYPLQNHLRVLGTDIAARALAEMAQPGQGAHTMKDWLAANFGPTLCELFFHPFNELYTAGLYDRIAPQDAYKSPVDLALAIRGTVGDTPPVGYNAGFAYPPEGLSTLARRLADRGRVTYRSRAAKIHLDKKVVEFEDGRTVRYDVLLSTLPLNRALEMADLRLDIEPDPFTSVLVLNIGARRGAACPDDHWIYVPHSRSGFHRVGFYDNVDPEFLPAASRDRADRVSIYVERAYEGGRKPSEAEIATYGTTVVRELQEWDFIEEVEVLDPTWIDVAYTWSWPGSRWTRVASNALLEHDVFSIGRYGRWVFQGIAESIREGFAAGAAIAHT